MMLVRPLMTNLKVTARADCAVSVCRTPPSIYKNSCPLIVSRVVVGLEGRSAFGQEPALPSTPRLPASETKQAFLPTSLASLLAFERPAADPRSVTQRSGKLTWCAPRRSCGSGRARGHSAGRRRACWWGSRPACGCCRSRAGRTADLGPAPPPSGSSLGL